MNLRGTKNKVVVFQIWDYRISYLLKHHGCMAPSSMSTLSQYRGRQECLIGGGQTTISLPEPGLPIPDFHSQSYLSRKN